MPFVFVKNVVQITFLQWPLINANIFGKIFLDALYDCIYFFPSPRAVATIRILSKLSQSPGNGISETLNLKISSSLWPSFLAPNQKEIPTALHASVIRLCVKYAYFCL